MNIQVHIERLVLDGVPLARGQEATLQATVETELTRLLAEGGPLALTGGAVPVLNGGTMALADGANAHQVGRGVAQAVYGGISR